MDLVRNARQGINAVTLDREVEINNIKAALAERYDLILVIFQHYCGAGEIGERYGMSTLEFSHFLRLCGIVVQGNADSYTVEPPREKMEAKEDAKGDDHDDDDQGSKAEESVAFFEEAMKAFVEVTVVVDYEIQMATEECRYTHHAERVEKKYICINCSHCNNYRGSTRQSFHSLIPIVNIIKCLKVI